MSVKTNSILKNSKGKPKVYGICTDTIIKNGEIVLIDGKRVCGAVGWYRVMNPLKKLGHEVTVGMGLKAKVEDALELKSKGDIWFSKMSDNEGIDNIYAAHKESMGCKFVLDLDDDPGKPNYDHPDYQALVERMDMRTRMIRMADHVVVSTPQIKESIKEINRYVTVIPNAIDPEIWKFKNKIKKDGKIRIGWISSGSHLSDIPIIQPVMDAILSKYKNVEFHFAGMTWDETQDDRFYHHVGVRAYKDFPKWYADQGYDIGIAPLKDTKFNQAKSNIKWMEAAMLEIPIIASDIEPYKCIKHGIDGFLASTTEQWVRYVSLLIENEEKRREIGRNAKKSILKDWTTDKFLPLYEELFKKLVDKKDLTVVTAITANKDYLRDQPEYPGVQYVAFTKQKSETWRTRKPYEKFKDAVMNAKIHKILTHKYIDTDYIVWMDGNINLKQDPHKLIKLMGNNDYAFFKHPGRNCIYEEAIACVQYGKGKVGDYAEQIKDYSNPDKYDVPENIGLFEMTCFIRKNNPHTNEMFEKWWAEICRYSNRDQISLPVVFRDEVVSVIPGSVAKIEGNNDFPGNDYFQYNRHKK